MPYYIANHETPEYRIKKRLFALHQLEKNGFLTHLAGLPKAKAVILFGSITRSDWYKDSDIDVFIYGNPEGYKPKQLKKEVETFVCKDEKELAKLPEGLLRNVLGGYLIKGSLDFIKVTHA